MSQVQVNLSRGFLLKQYTVLLFKRSCATITFSPPLIIKYPPWSYSHSPADLKAFLFKRFVEQIFDLRNIQKPVETFSIPFKDRRFRVNPKEEKLILKMVDFLREGENL